TTHSVKQSRWERSDRREILSSRQVDQIRGSRGSPLASRPRRPGASRVSAGGAQGDAGRTYFKPSPTMTSAGRTRSDRTDGHRSGRAQSTFHLTARVSELGDYRTQTHYD